MFLKTYDFERIACKKNRLKLRLLYELKIQGGCRRWNNTLISRGNGRIKNSKLSTYSQPIENINLTSNVILTGSHSGSDKWFWANLKLDSLLKNGVFFVYKCPFQNTSVIHSCIHVSRCIMNERNKFYEYGSTARMDWWLTSTNTI